MNTSILRYCFLTLCAVFISTFAHAQVQPADSPCDADYYDSLEARAWLEAQREITQNQNLIFKPDSVLEYTCFDKYLDVLADKALDMFSETTRWGEILPSDSMDTALEELVGVANFDYNQSNFQHKFLGDRLNPGKNPGHPDEDYVPDTIAGGAYTCDRMNIVWMQAKCMDFIDNADEDGFFTFEEYQNDPDKRFLPNRCGAIAARWGTNINESTEDATPWQEDEVNTYLNLLDPNNCGSARPHSSGVPLKDGKTEHFCIPGGCHWDGGTGCTN